MCCLFTVLAFLGPRAALALWWLFDMSWFSRVYDTFIWPFLGFLFLPLTTLMWSVILKIDPATGVSGWNWIWIILALVGDILSYSGGGYGNRNRFMRTGTQMV
jgi:hypothetical protein